jgi:hypothetical protein
MTSYHSYPTVYALGHRAISELLLDQVIVEEKIDGSQISFGLFDGVLKTRSHHKEMEIDAPEKMFKKAVEHIKTLQLHDGWTYRGELLCKSKHNTLEYDRIPKGGIIIYDINTAEEQYLNYNDKHVEADRIGLETVPIFTQGRIDNSNDIIGYLDKISILGKSKIEGVVIKNYNRFGLDKKVLMGKYVSEQFKEVHQKEWKESNPKQGDIVQRLITMYKTIARWNKAVLHLAERGELDNSPKDIGKLILEVKEDIKKECQEEIKEILYKWAIDNILRGATAGFPEWYKKELLEKQFEVIK